MINALIGSSWIELIEAEEDVGGSLHGWSSAWLLFLLFISFEKKKMMIIKDQKWNNNGKLKSKQMSCRPLTVARDSFISLDDCRAAGLELCLRAYFH